MLSKSIHNVNIDVRQTHASNPTYSLPTALLLTSVVTKLQFIKLNRFLEPLGSEKSYM